MKPSGVVEQPQPGVKTDKPRAAFARPCPKDRFSPIFPLDSPPSSWESCGDAYEYTWLHEVNDPYFVDVDDEDRLRLARSMGFCPERRCQLGYLGNADVGGVGMCPEGLCYTKLVEGSPSFGACCYTAGKFMSGSLIGYHAKQRPMQKPIYERGRIVLGRDNHNPRRDADSYEAFINANEVYPGIILTQCPLLSAPHDASRVETLTDWKRMIIEYGVSLVVQVHPEGEASGCEGRLKELCKNPCVDWAVRIFAEGDTSVSSSLPVTWKGSQDMSHLHSKLVEYFYSIEEEGGGAARDVRHLRFRGWGDFGVPEGENAETVEHLANEIVRTVLNGGKVAVVCYSGRGRSGTLASLAIARLEGVESTRDLVRAIVKMREYRDSLVETPAQFDFVRRTLDLREGDLRLRRERILKEFVGDAPRALLFVPPLVLVFFSLVVFGRRRRKKKRDDKSE